MQNQESPRHFSKQERSYLSKVSVALQNPPEPETVKMWLRKAAQDGVDPQRIYEAALSIRPPHWEPAPPFHVICPEWVCIEEP